MASIRPGFLQLYLTSILSTRSSIPTTREKALQLNLDKTKYGAFAEIGAGQETAAWFFRVGGASGTVAKSISAYDMQMSDAIYGSGPRYVSRERLAAMLDHEFRIVQERLGPKRGGDTNLFAFANTVRARAYQDTDNAECHGWLGIRFLTHPQGQPHDILLHVRMFDPSNIEQQRALGVLGVNLVYAAFYYRENLEIFVESLMDELSIKSVEVDTLKFSGPDFADIDNRECALVLVEKGLTNSAFFTADGEVMQVAEKLYKKPVLMLRGSFNPVTVVHMDMLESAAQTFRRTLASPDTPFVEIMEFSMNNFFQPVGELTHADFLQRADVLQKLGKNVLISKFDAFHRLAGYLSRYTNEPVALTLSVDVLEKLFHEAYYEQLAGGILEGFGRLFKTNVRLYVYPILERDSGTMKVAQDAKVPPHLRHLFLFLLENNKIASLVGCARPDLLRFWTTDVRRMMEDGDERWKTLVPEAVVEAYSASTSGPPH